MAWLRYLHSYLQQEVRADLLGDFERRFMELTCEEQGRASVITKGETLGMIDKVLRASCNYQKHPEVWLNRDNPERRNYCLLDTPPHGIWNYDSRGISENFFERVRLCVTEAGCTLPDYPKGTDPEDFWLHRLYLDLLRNNSDLLFCGTKEGGMILSVCVASATFCARLRRHALGRAGEDAKSSIVASLEETENLDEAAAAAFQQQVKAARLSLALGRPLPPTTGPNQAEPSPSQNRAKSAQSVDAENRGKTGKAVESKPSGRPRKDAERQLVRELKGKGESWKEIAARVNAKTGQNKSPEAYRGLLKSPSAAGKNGQK